jgi:hypothetical protein
MQDQEPATEDTMTAALLREREALVVRGLDDRVAQVDAQLKLRGYKPGGAQQASDKGEEPDDPATDDARQTPPKSPKTGGARQQTRNAD